MFEESHRGGGDGIILIHQYTQGGWYTPVMNPTTVLHKHLFYTESKNIYGLMT